MIKHLKQGHISRQFNSELERICFLLLTMGGLVEKQFIDAFDANFRGNMQLAAQVKQGDDQVNQLKVDIDEASEQIIIRRQPTAGDLRLILGIIKMSTETERLGNNAKRIAEITTELTKLNQQYDLARQFKSLGEKLSDLLNKTLNAFARMDESTTVVCKLLNDELNASCLDVRSQLVHSLSTDAENAESLLSVIVAMDTLRHAGERCVDICEHIRYAIKGYS